MSSTETPYTIPATMHNGTTIFCADGPRVDGRRPFDDYRRAVKWSHQSRAWLAERIGCDPTDPRLDLKAINAALAGRLVLYVNREGVIGNFGKPRRVKR